MPTMPTRKIGDAEVSAVGFGAMGIGGGVHGPTGMSLDERLKVLDRAFELGCTFWDTANIYGDSEALIGEWFRRNPEKRAKIFLATKFSFVIGGEHGAPVSVSLDASPKAARENCDKSLKNLGVDKIDLYYVHSVDPKIPIEITIAAMAELVKQGKVRYIGVSNCSAQCLRRAQAVHPIAAYQTEYAPITLDIEDPKIGVLAACRELGIAVVNHTPLSKGVLTGQVKSPDDFPEGDTRRYFPRYSKDNFPKLLAVADALKTIGEKHGATAGQVALAWILAQGTDFIPIPGTKSIKYLEENVGAAYVKLSADEVAEIRKLSEESGASDVPPIPQKFYEEFAFQDSLPLEEYKD
ncbi:Aldo/keto reductase [Calocera viscosa TUFC12733]|uniref:Aldo/keto reductase n=1 Tax=Calocera viscosa (strain TUFC12733) TaxID=1330018 RepID=A0A167HRX2_CALVF|nr:Aldo/keto reductase [Calocera viscosa TUFC12733]